MSRKIYGQSAQRVGFSTLLSKIDANQPLLLLPLRLETHFRGSEGGKRELCVRIYPDEIFLDYTRQTLTPEELEAGKYFWMQWYIASGSQTREYEAWEVLCKKYKPAHAAWVARMTRFDNFYSYLPGNPLFYRRPYGQLIRVDEACDMIYSHLEGVVLDDDNTPYTSTGETKNEHMLRVCLVAVKEELSKIDADIMYCERIVDYLYDKLTSTLSFLSLRLDTFQHFYDRYPHYTNNTRTLEAWDLDYTLLKSMREDVRLLMAKFEGKRISLDEMIRNYLDDPKNDIFPKALDNSRKPHAPQVSLLPDRFLLIAEPMDKDKPQRVYFGNPVNHKIKMVPDPEAIQESIRLKDGMLAFTGPLKWMADYDQACADGMAITLPLEKDETAFRYLYVLGISEKADIYSFAKVLNGHNYLGEGMSFISRNSVTNLVDGGAGSDVLSLEQERRIRYDIEVRESFNFSTLNDSHLLATDVKIPYTSCLGRIPRYDLAEREKTKVAFRYLWDVFVNKIKGAGEEYDAFLGFVGDFLVDYVSGGTLFPMFRIGDVPYGILPVTDHERVLSSIKSGEDFQLSLLYKTLVTFGKEWKRLREDDVIAAERLAGADAERDYLSMAGQTPRSLDINTRWMIDSPLLPDRGAMVGDALTPLSKAHYFRATPVADGVKKFDTSVLASEIRNRFKAAGLQEDEKEIETLICEFFDLFTHRLDAWFTGMAYYLLKHPEARTGGVRKEMPVIGAYGWVFDLQENRKTDSKLKDEGEYILAPSIQHALSAAVLRAAYLNTKGVEGDPHMCVNLSSMRARAALRMVDGLKNGMSSGVVLGADLERYLHDAYDLYGTWMDAFIYPLRKLFPLSIDIKAEQTEDRKVKAANYMMQVINGEALLNTFLTTWNYNGRLAKWLEDNREKLPWYELLSKTPFFNDDLTMRTVLFQCIERMYDSYDALNDLLLAEGVHRLVMGDEASFTAITRFMSKGTGNLPDPEILKSPMKYASVSHKTALVLPKASKASGRLGKAEPDLNAWVLEKLGGMGNIWFKVEYTGPDNVVSIDPFVSLADVGVEPLEYLYVSGNEHAFMTLLEYRWRIRTGQFRGKVRILTGNPAQQETFEIMDAPLFTLYEDSLRISSLRSMLTHSSVMTVSAWNPLIVSDADIARTTDLDELSGRYIALHASMVSLEQAMASVLGEIQPGTPLDDDTLSEMLSLQAECLSCAVFEAAGDYPAALSLTGVDKIRERIDYDAIVAQQERFAARFNSILEEVRRRIAAAEAKAPAKGDPFSADAYMEAIKALTLNSFCVIPRFCPQGFIEEGWEDTYTQILREGLSYYQLTPEGFQNWLDSVGSARSGVRLWNDVAMFQEMAGIPEDVPVILQQRSSVGNNRHWIGLPLPENDEPDSADSMVIFGGDRLRRGLRSTFSGLIFDGWTEYLPLEDNTAGVVFRADQPDAEAPQAILLAAYPELNRTDHGAWDLDHILDILDSTRFQMMNRAVDPDLILHDPKLSKIFPLLSDLDIDLTDDGFVYTSFVAPHIVRRKIRAAIETGIFDYMPGGTILKDFLNDASYE